MKIDNVYDLAKNALTDQILSPIAPRHNEFCNDLCFFASRVGGFMPA